MTALDRLMAKAVKQGPCFLCGETALARHRTWDAIDADLQAGARELTIARNYVVKVQEVRDVREAYAEARRRKRPLPGRQGGTDAK